jgi:hypothetical protein
VQIRKGKCGAIQGLPLLQENKRVKRSSYQVNLRGRELRGRKVTEEVIGQAANFSPKILQKW